MVLFFVYSFEIMMYVIFLINYIIYIQSKNWQKILNIFSGFLFGLILEYSNIFFYGNYEYNIGFILQLGKSPTNIPICIAVGWGLILNAVMSVSDRINIPNRIRVLFDACLGLSLDLSMDIVAIRLDGGFWRWLGIPTDSFITLEGVLGVNWGNYYGWFCVILIFSSLTRFERKKLKFDKYKYSISLLISFFKPFLSTLLLFGAYFIQYPIITKFETVAYSTIIVVGGSFIYIFQYFIRKKPKIKLAVNYNVNAKQGAELGDNLYKIKKFLPTLLFLSFHVYFIIASIIIEIPRDLPIFFIFSLILFLITLALDFFILNKSRNK